MHCLLQAHLCPARCVNEAGMCRVAFPGTRNDQPHGFDIFFVLVIQQQALTLRSMIVVVLSIMRPGTAGQTYNREICSTVYPPPPLPSPHTPRLLPLTPSARLGVLETKRQRVEILCVVTHRVVNRPFRLLRNFRRGNVLPDVPSHVLAHLKAPRV